MTTLLDRLEPAGFLQRPALRALLGLVALGLIALMIAPRTLVLESLVSMAPFIGVLGVAAIGQHLVIQQRGFDLSVAGSISLAAVIVTALPSEGAGPAATLAYAGAALFVGAAAGLLNGVVINRLGVPALVMTIGSNALLFGCVYFLSRGAVHAAPDPLIAAANLRIGSICVLFFVFLLIALFAAWVIERTTVGRRFIMSAVSPEASRALGVRVGRYNVATYAMAGFLFALAGVMLAGLAVTPTLLSGQSYMLTTVAAVIVGGSPLNGDRGSVVSTIIGVIFLIFMDQLVVSLGFDYAVQSMVQAAIILVGVTVPELLRQARRRPARDGGPAPHRRPSAYRAAPGAAAILELNGVRKTFGNTTALAGVDFSAFPGEVHAIIGENGAGKSTLISIAAGVLSASEGRVRIAGEVMSGSDPNLFRAAGISVAFQHPPLPPHLSVLECLCLSAPELGASGGAERASALIDRVSVGSLGVSPQDRIADLSIGQRHVVEIARALASKPSILVLDEPTEPFKEDDVAQLFALIRHLKARGVAVVYISHRLNEVEEIADRISVLRDGELVETRRRADFTHDEIIGMIVGRPLGHVFPEKSVASDMPVVLEVRNLSGHRFHDVSFEARRGEIIGLAGVEGQGQRELIRALAGLETCSGDIVLDGRSLSYADRPAARAAGVAFVPDDRHREGLFLSLSVDENLNAGASAPSGLLGMIDRGAESEAVSSAIRELKIRTASAEASVSSLSGGNQQKVLVGREIGGRPRLFLADEPTKGVDIGSKSDIYRELRELANRGVTVIVASSDGVELEGLCDRVLVMARGSIACDLNGARVSDAEITAANLTAGAGLPKRQDRDSARGRFRHILESKWLPAGALSLVSALIFYCATAANARFLSAYNLENLQVQLATLALIAFGQLFLMILGEIDFSVGPLAGFAVVLASYWIPDGASPIAITAACVGIVLVTTVIALLQGLVVVGLKLPSIVVTLAAFFALQGLSLSLRPLPGGTISSALVDTLLYAIGPVSVVTLLVVMAALGFEFSLFRTHFGRSIRALGSDRSSAQKLGVNRGAITAVAFAANGAMVGIAGLVLAATVGVGSGTAGVNFTLMSITAVVLGGAVISGGYGSFLSTAFGALLVQATFSATTFMQVGVEWQYWLVGLSTLLAAGAFSFGRNKTVHA
ncbi:ATP-binding cassette domain-containing protein [Labrys wisconsinensis]|uniref:Ribose transport system ATP-binding protein n=1 Tax=Labrys wisconsinensis TaxID=425677 RepID=A0ABU0JBZ6_9HYPH|nr:ATP-binding cassette domain-containing protein [Labrys wisconsinensis]MDQ0471803.1 ribose transport system ATP-binding protein [Labrys wisconsinensis]